METYERGVVNDVQAESGDAEAGLAVLTTVFNPMEAEIIAAKLRSASIDCAIRHDALSSVYGLTVDGAGRQDIMVRASDLTEAQAALEVADEGAPEWTSDDDDDDDCEC
jgi:hypothetical protein